jgi:hypothetical protein
MMRKGITAPLIEDVLTTINGAVNIAAYMIVGFPTETEAEALAGHKKLCEFLEKGLITKYTYNAFQIVYGSDIWSHPELYGISEVSVPEGCDLNPNLYNFTTQEGMSRECARQLEFQFNQQIEPFLQNFLMKEIFLDGQIIPAKHDLHHLANLITGNAFLDLPFARMLDKYREYKLHPGMTMST